MTISGVKIDKNSTNSSFSQGTGCGKTYIPHILLKPRFQMCVASLSLSYM